MAKRKPKPPNLPGAAEGIRAAEASNQRAFFGRSGQLAVMAEFLARGINVAIPEVDVGDDVFVVKGAEDLVTRVQSGLCGPGEAADFHPYRDAWEPWPPPEVGVRTPSASPADEGPL